MKYNMKQLLFIAVTAILSLFLLTCFPGPDDYKDFVLPEFTDVEYSPDGSSVTIYLDGSAPVRSSRALHLKWAQIGYDFFEVTFMSGSTVARATWETGHAAGVNGVVRGVNYASAIPGANAAILFVGKKSDKTLLAVGRLTHVNNGTGTEPGTTVTADTRSVTFSVAALNAGVSDSPNFSSFKTNALLPGPGGGVVNADNTEVFMLDIGPEFAFPLFRMDRSAVGGQIINAQYEFGVAGDNFELYREGIRKKGTAIVKTEGGVYDRVPRYPVGKNDWVISPTASPHKYLVDGGTPVTIVNTANNTAVFPNPPPALPVLQFTIGPTDENMDSKVFAFAFEVPVYPLTNVDSRANGDSWYLRPGYDSYLYDLDDGFKGSGGSILMGTGRFDASISSGLFVRKPPAKTRYNGADNDGPGSAWIFDIRGMDLYLRRGDIITKLYSLVDPPINAGIPDLYFFVQKGGEPLVVIQPGDNIEQVLIDHNVEGEVTVYMEYYGYPPVDRHGVAPFILSGGVYVRNPAYQGVGDSPKTGEFQIFYLPIGSGLDFTIPNKHRFVIVNYQDINLNLIANNVFNDATADDGVTPNTSFLMVLFASVDLPAINLPVSTNPVFIVVIAGAPGVVVGSSSATGGVFINPRANNTYYLGVWPFDEVLAVQGMAVQSHPFVINAGGSYSAVTFDADGNPSAPAYGGGMTDYFIDGAFAKTVNDMGVRVVNRLHFIEPYP